MRVRPRSGGLLFSYSLQPEFADYGEHGITNLYYVNRDFIRIWEQEAECTLSDWLNKILIIYM